MGVPTVPRETVTMSSQARPGSTASSDSPRTLLPALAPHVRTAVERSRGFGNALAQPKSALSPATAPHVQAAVERARTAAAPVVQRATRSEGDQRLHNVNVVCSYSVDTGKRVRDAFIDAGYTLGNWQAAAVKALKNTEWHHSTIAHGLGSSTSGVRGGTKEDIQACADHLVRWAAEHPAEKKTKTKKYSGYTGPKKDPKDDPDKGGTSGGDRPYGTGHLASWITGVSAWYPHRTDLY
jgi:hypothetical protein